DLDAAVARGELALHFLDQLIERILDSDRHARRDPVARATEDARKRLAAPARVEGPRRHFDGGLRHVLAPGRLERGKHVARVRERRADHARRDEVPDDVPAGVVRLGAVVRILIRDAFAEPARAVAVHAHQDEVLVFDAAEAGLEEMYERELQESQLESIYLHRLVRTGMLRGRAPVANVIIRPPCRSAPSRSKGPSAREKPRSPSGSGRDPTTTSSSNKPTTHTSR